MQAWWDALSIIEKVFWLIAIPFSLVFIIQMILSFIGMGGGATDPGADISGLNMDSVSETHNSIHSNEDAGPGFSFFTIRNFIAFFTVFSWSGIAFNNAGIGNGTTILLAILTGILAMLIISSLFYFAMKMADSGNISIKNAVGATGKVYLPIKAGKGNIGKVHVTFQGNLREMQAITNENSDLPTNTIVKVTGIAGDNILLVEKI